MNNAKISIIIPVWNSEQYLEQCLDSVTNQTFKDLEIICINDGSPDNSLEILEKYAQKDGRIVIINQENQGTGISRNNAIKIAKGEYIMFLDSDDWYDLDYCEKAYNRISETDTDIVLLAGVINYYPQNKTKGFKQFKALSKKYGDNVFYLFECENNIEKINHLSWNKIYKRNFLIKNTIEYSSASNGEDQVFLYKLILANPKACISEDSNYYYRRDSGNSNQRQVAKPVKDMILAVYATLDFILSSTQDKETKLFLLSFNLKTQYKYCVEKTPKSKRKEYYYSLQNLLKGTIRKYPWVEDKLKNINADCYMVLHNGYELFLIKQFLSKIFSITCSEYLRRKKIYILGIKLYLKC